MGIGPSRPVGDKNYERLDFDRVSPAGHAQGADSSDYHKLLNSLQEKGQPDTCWQDFSIKEKNIGDVSALVAELDKAYPDHGWKSVAITLNGVTTFLRNPGAAGSPGIQFILPKEAGTAYEKELPPAIPLGTWVTYDAREHGPFFHRMLSHFGTEISSEQRATPDEPFRRPFSRASNEASLDALHFAEAGILVQPTGENARPSAPALDFWTLNDGHANVEVELNNEQLQPHRNAEQEVASSRRQPPVPPPYTQKARNQAIPQAVAKASEPDPDNGPLEF
jgi:hypothetical protein